MAFEPGNQLAAKAHRISRALERALAQENWRRLHLGAEKVADAFANGERWAIEYCSDRLEGKAVAKLEVSHSDTRELDLASIMRLVMQARSASADDAQVLEAPADPAPTTQSLPSQD